MQSVFAGEFYRGIIDEEGAFYIIDKELRDKAPSRFYIFYHRL